MLTNPLFRSLCIAVFLVVLSAASLSSGAAQPPFPPITPEKLASSLLPDLSPQIRVTLDRPEYRIRMDAKTGAPQMPKEIVATAEPIFWPENQPKPTLFTWSVSLEWTMPGLTTRHKIADALFVQPSPFRIDVTNQVRGGVLTVKAMASLNGQTIYGKGQAMVVADNPSRAVVLSAFPKSRFGLLASKIGTAESNLKQFNSDGLPEVSASGDAGMMQLNVPTGAVTSEEQIWDWRANLIQGLEMLEGKRRWSVSASRRLSGSNWEEMPADCQASLCALNLARAVHGLPSLNEPTVPPLSTLPGSGMLPGEADPDKLNLSQIERDAVRRYNGGREYTYVLTADPDTLTITAGEWCVDPTRGGISPRSGVADYVDRVLLAHSGFTLPPPPKPKKKIPAKPEKKNSKKTASSRHKRVSTPLPPAAKKSVLKKPDLPVETGSAGF